MTEATVVYNAIADFAQLRREIQATKREIKELQAEEAKYNAAQAKTSGVTNHQKAAKAVFDESKAVDGATKSTKSYAQSVFEQAKATRNATDESKKFGISQKTNLDTAERLNTTSRIGTQETDRATKSTKDHAKATAGQVSSLRDLEGRFNAARTAQDRLRASQEAAATAARRSARDTQEASEASAAASRRAADAIIRDQERTRRVAGAPILTDSNNLRGGTRNSPFPSPIIGGDLRGRRDPFPVPIIDGNLRGGTRGGGSPPISPPRPPIIPPTPNLPAPGAGGPDPDSEGSPLKKTIKVLDKVAGAFAKAILAGLKFALIGAAILPVIAILGALASAALGAAGAFSEIAGVALTLPGIFAVATLSVGTLVVALKGVGAAFKAASAITKTAAQDAITASRAQRDAAIAVTDAEIALTRAKQDQSRVVSDAAERITDAERNLAETQQDQARNEIDSANRIIDANNGLERSQVHLKRAQEDLNQARKDALQSLIDLRREVEHGTLNEESAIAALRRAQDAYNKTLADPASTQTDKISALSTLHEAQQRITDVQDANRKSQEQLTKETKKGVEGSDRVVNAKETLIDTEKSLREATIEQVRSREDQTRSEKAYVDQVVDAQKELKRARQDESRAVIDASQAIIHAENALIRAQEAVTDAQFKNLASQKAFQAALDKLSPSAQKFVLGILSMRDAWSDLRKSVQEAFFQPVVGQLKNISDSLPFIKENLVKVAGALGEVTAKFIKWITSPAMRPFFKDLADATAKIIRIAGPALIKLFDGLAKLIIVSLPFIVRIAQAFDNAATSFQNFMSSAKGQKEVNGWLEQGFKRVSEFWQIIVNLGSAFGSLLTAARPFNDWIVNGLIKGSQHFKDFAAAQKLDGSPFKTYLENVKPLLQEIGGLLKDFVGYIFQQAADPKNISRAIDLLSKLRTELGPAVAHLLSVLRDKDILGKFVTALSSVIEAIAKFVEKGGGKAFEAVIGAFGFLAKAFQKIVDATPAPVISAIATALGAMAVLKFTGVFKLLGILASAGLPELAAGVAAVAGAFLLFNKVKDLNKNKADPIKEPDVVKKNAFETVRRPGHFAEGPTAPGQPRLFIPDRVRAPGPVIPGQAAPTALAPEITERTPLGKRVDDIKKSISDTWKTIKKFGSDLKKLFGPDLEKIWDTLKEKAGPAFEKIGKDLGKVWEAAKPVLEIIGGALLLAMKVFSSVMANVIGPAIDFFVGTLDGLLRVLQGVLEFIGGVFTGNWQMAWQGIKDIFGGIWDGILNGLKNIPKIIFEIIKGLVEGVVNFFKWLWDVLVGHSIIPDLINAIIDWFLSLPKRLLGIVGDLVHGIFNLWKKVFSELGKLLEKAFGPIKDTFINLFDGVLGYAKGFWEKIIDIFKKPIEFLINTVLDKGLIQGVNFILKFLHIDEIPRIHLKFAEGGKVPGSGDQDSIPAMLTPGEVVIKKKSVEKIGLARALFLNEHGYMPYAKGGVVPRQRFGGGGFPNPIGIVKGIGKGIVGGVKAVGKGVIEGIEFIGNLTREVAAKMLEVVFNRVRGIVKHIPGGNILGVPVGIAEKVMSGIAGFVRGGNDNKDQPQKKAQGGLIQKFAQGGVVEKAKPVSVPSALSVAANAVEQDRAIAGFVQNAMLKLVSIVAGGRSAPALRQGLDYLTTKKSQSVSTSSKINSVLEAVSGNRSNKADTKYALNVLAAVQKVARQNLSSDTASQIELVTRYRATTNPTLPEVNKSQLAKSALLHSVARLSNNIALDKSAQFNIIKALDFVRAGEGKSQKKARGGLVEQPNLAQMFAAGGLVQPPQFVMPKTNNLSSVERSMNSSVVTNNTDNSRTDGSGRGFVVENLNIHNPRPEPASDSLPNTIRKIAYLSS